MLPRAGLAQQRKERLTRELDNIEEKLSALPAVRLAILFGSLASGRIASTSDIDLIVVMDTDKRFLDRLDELYRHLGCRVALDILAYTPQEFEAMKESNAFVRRALAEGTVLYEG